MTDTELSRWIVEKVFKECWHEAYWPVRGPYRFQFRCKRCRQISAKKVHFYNPKLCTPDGSALLKAKAIELGEWDEFKTWFWYHNKTSRSIWPKIEEIFETTTTPRLFAEAFRAFWIERGKA